MKITIRPPCQIIDPHRAATGAKIAHLHLQLWLELKLDDWGVQRSTHLHFIRDLERGRKGDEWRRVDLSSHPLQRVKPEEVAQVPEWIEEGVEEWIDELEVELYRSSELGVVSEIWESEVDFRLRIRGILRPEVRRRIEGLNSVSPSRLPWRRRAAGTARRESKERLAAGISRMIGAVETRRIKGMAGFTRGVDVRVLLVPEGFRPQGRPRRERMIEAPDPGREPR